MLATAFSLLSSDASASVFTTGDAGMVLRRLRSPSIPVLRIDVDDRGLDLVVVEMLGREAGVADTLADLVGLSVLFLAGVACAGVLLAGVAETGFGADTRSEVVVGANDIRLGFADMPSLFSSAEVLPSTELTDARFS